MALLEAQEPQDQQVLMEQLDQPDHREVQALLDLPAQVVLQVQQDHKGQLEPLAQQV